MIIAISEIRHVDDSSDILILIEPFNSNINVVFVGRTNIHAAIEPFLHAKWQELFRL